jgi:GPH family glycoside/pentoside/hexuronide:cation symporter
VESSTESRVSIKEKLGYGAGDMACNLVFQPIAVYLLFFYTDIFGLAPAAASVLFLVARVWDAINDPIMGFVVDRTRSRWGKLRPYILWGALPLGVLGVLCFTVPQWGNPAKLAYAYVTYIGLGMLFTLVNVPYAALTSAMTQDTKQRTSLSAYRMIGATLGGMVAIVGLPLLAEALGGENQARGYQLSMILFAVVGTALLMWTFFSTRERVAAPKAKVNLKAVSKILSANRPLIFLSLFFLFFLGYEAVSNSSAIFYLKYHYDREDLISLFTLALIVPMLITTAFVPALAKRLGKRKLLFIGILVNLVSPIGILLFPGNIVILFATKAVSGVGYGVMNVLAWAFVPDTVEYGQYKTGIRSEGMVYSIVGFFLKTGFALGGLIPGLVLNLTGYVANQAQTETALAGIQSLMTYIPAALVLLGLVMMVFYNLDEDKYEEIVAELRGREEHEATE